MKSFEELGITKRPKITIVESPVIGVNMIAMMYLTFVIRVLLGGRCMQKLGAIFALTKCLLANWSLGLISCQLPICQFAYEKNPVHN